jgi:hypothetical protein
MRAGEVNRAAEKLELRLVHPTCRQCWGTREQSRGEERRGRRRWSMKEVWRLTYRNDSSNDNLLGLQNRIWIRHLFRSCAGSERQMARQPFSTFSSIVNHQS